MFGLSPVELGICVVVVVLLFGTKKLPELGSGLGQAISNFKKGYKDAQAIDVTPKESSDKNQSTEKKPE
jgi:sec-independent protein translocase protein TatA